MQIVADKFSDAKVLQAAKAYESEHPFVMPKITRSNKVAPPESILPT
jgi:Asp-tRNA(Asn)/Glu-tRNA(Gln) amidotransferase A subunit family amidase